MAAKDLPPVPDSVPIADKNTGLLSRVWSEWFRQISSASSEKLATGYEKLPGGVVIQWGVTGSTLSASSTTVLFPTEFPTGCLQVIAGVRDNSAVDTIATGQWGTGNYTVTGFDLYNRTSGTRTFNWIAVGY